MSIGYNKKMKFWHLFLLGAIFCGCSPDYVMIAGDGEFALERSFLETLIGEDEGLKELGLRLLPGGDGSKAPQAALFVEILSSWEQEAAFGDILISRKFFVPREDPLAGRIDTSL